MSNINHVELTGNITRDIEYKGNEDVKKAVARFSVAVQRKFGKGEDGKPQTDFFNCVAFGYEAQFISKYFQKGSGICVTGRLQNSNYTNKEGQKVYSTGIIVEDTDFKGNKNSNSGMNQNTSTDGTKPASMYSSDKSVSTTGFENIPGEIDEELPFS